MLLNCLKASITTSVYTKVFLQRSNNIIHKQPGNIPLEDGVCFLKVIIDSYHSNTRSSTTEVRRQLAHLDKYMVEVAKGDVTKLCNHARSLLYELNAAGEATQDLITNLITGLKRAPDANFQQWFSNQIDLWSMRQKDWRPDGGDLILQRSKTNKVMGKKRFHTGGQLLHNTFSQHLHGTLIHRFFSSFCNCYNLSCTCNGLASPLLCQTLPCLCF